MPSYNYQCENKHGAEVTHSITEDPEIICGVCQSIMRRVPSVAVVTFNGSGFYSKDKNA